MGGVYVTYVANVDKRQWHVGTLVWSLNPWQSLTETLIKYKSNKHYLFGFAFQILIIKQPPTGKMSTADFQIVGWCINFLYRPKLFKFAVNRTNRSKFTYFRSWKHWFLAFFLVKSFLKGLTEASFLLLKCCFIRLDVWSLWDYRWI